MTTCLAKSYSFGLLCVSIVKVNRFVYILLDPFDFEGGMRDLICISSGTLPVCLLCPVCILIHLCKIYMCTFCQCSRQRLRLLISFDITSHKHWI